MITCRIYDPFVSALKTGANFCLASHVRARLAPAKMRQSASTTDSRQSPPMRYIPLSYNQAESQASALRLVLALNPHWEHAEGKIEFVRFTDGITNTVRT